VYCVDQATWDVYPLQPDSSAFPAAAQLTTTPGVPNTMLVAEYLTKRCKVVQYDPSAWGDSRVHLVHLGHLSSGSCGVRSQASAKLTAGSTNALATFTMTDVNDPETALLPGDRLSSGWCSRLCMHDDGHAGGRSDGDVDASQGVRTHSGGTELRNRLLRDAGVL
jgi:hypothetical protein